MKKRFISFLSGMVVGAVMFGGSVAYASGILADLSNNQIFVDGTLTPMEAYVINGHNYVKLRDIGQAVGFNVFWDDTAKCVQVESDKPYTGIAPTKQEGEKTSGQLHQTDVDAIKKDVVTRTNTLRLNKGVAVLKVNNLLMDAAQVRADEMAASGAYSHTRPDGRRSNTVTDSRRTGENIHCITELYLEQQHKTLSDAVVNLWSNSKGHADNMLNARYGEIGVGLARGTDSNGLACWYCVQVFLVDGCEVTWVDVPAIGYYKVTFKTNLNDYRTLASNLLTSNNYSLSLNAATLRLVQGEYVTDVRFEFGTVPSGFSSVVKPTMRVQVLGTVSNGYQIINRADVGGQYLNEWQTAKTTWVTTVRRFNTTPLPKTGY